MTSITWKDGGPLMTANGLIGGSPACCCENPPPPVCVCPDTCSYFIEVVSPSIVALKSASRAGTAICARTSVTETVYDAAPFALPDGFRFFDDAQIALDAITSVAVNDVLGSSLLAYVSYNCHIRPEDDSDARKVIVGFICVAEARCSTVGDEPAWSIELGVNMVVRVRSLSEPWSPGADRLLTLSHNIPLPAQCDSNRARLCSPPPPGDEASHIATPLVVTATGEGSDLGGDYAVDNDFSAGVGAELAESIAQHFLDQLSVTFRITSRRSCVSAPCSCSAAYGTEWTFSTGTRSKTFTHGIDDVEWGGSPYYFSWDGVGYMVLEIFDPEDYVPGLGGLVIERHTVQISCETIDDVSTWMASVFSQCIQYNNVPQITHETYDEWAGVFECVPGCEDEHRAAGDPVLDGDLVDVEYLGRSTAVGTTECTPPPRISISVKQIATC
jgi:hypothetical protein